MSTLKVLVSDTLPEEGLRVLRDGGIEVLYRTGLEPEQLKKTIADCDGVIVRSATKLTADVIESASRLRAVCRAGVGVDNIDIPAASRKGVIVMNTPAGNTASTAEHTIAMMLAMSRNIPQAYGSLRAGQWERKKFVGTQVAGKILGVIGLGRVGCGVAERAVGLQMRVVGYDPYISKSRARDLGIELKEDLDELLRAADYVTVHTPLTKETENLIGKREFDIMKNGVRIINCARGGIVDEDALYDALTSGKVAGAALDVFRDEPPKDRRLVETPQVVCTPHLGASTEEAQILVAVEAAEQMRDALTDRGVRNAVNLPALDPKQAELLQPYIVLAEKMGSAAMQLAGGRVRDARLHYRGDIAKLDVSILTRAFIAGLLTPIFDEPVNIVNALLLAEQRHISFTEHKSDAPRDFANLIDVSVRTDAGERVLGGTLLGRDDPRIVHLDGYRVEILARGHILLTFVQDRPGLIGDIGKILGSHNINIGRMTFGRREAGGDAITALNVDSPVPPAVLKEVEAVRSVISAHLLTLS